MPPQLPYAVSAPDYSIDHFSELWSDYELWRTQCFSPEQRFSVISSFRSAELFAEFFGGKFEFANLLCSYHLSRHMDQAAN